MGRHKKITRAEALQQARAAEPTLDFLNGHSDAACSISQLSYLAELGKHIRGFKKPPNAGYSTGAAVYNHLHKLARASQKSLS